MHGLRGRQAGGGGTQAVQGEGAGGGEGGVMSKIMRVVGFSGGADSQATALWVRKRWPAENVILMNTNAGGNEHPLTEAFIAEYSRTVFPVVSVKALIRDLGDVGTKDGATGDRRREFGPDDELTFDRLAYIKGRFPSRKAQFCTEHLKLAPQLRWLRENLTDKGVRYWRYIGVRRDESAARKDTPLTRCDDYFGCMACYPLAAWTKPQVFAYIAENGEEANPLYKLGFGRVGCAPCINSGKDDILLWATRFPGMIDKLRAWEAKNGRTFFAPCVPGMEINFIDDVVKWAKTVRGGRQYALPFFEQEISDGKCMSKWGLCE
jgi:3'-phosphoadenosine 5'-phosphosulfate sulfotransferase (PAPS reductase)/FAD synthetase